MSQAATAACQLLRMSQWIDQSNKEKDPEAITWGRVGKVAEETGEVIAAYIGATRQNPRKGKTHTIDDVAKELLDVAITALCAYEHLDGHRGRSVLALFYHTETVYERACDNGMSEAQ